MVLLLVAALASVVLGFLFAAIESALSRIGRHGADALVDEGRRGAPALSRLVDDSAAVAMVLTFLRVVTEATAAVLVTFACREALHDFWAALLVAIAVMAIVSFVLVGVSPRTLGRQHSAAFALSTAPAVLWLHRLLSPVARALVALGNAVTPGRGYRDGPFDSEAELREYVDLATDSDFIEDDERKMIQSVFELDETVARGLMVPRTDMITVDRRKTLRQAMSLLRRSGFSRIPVTDGSPDDIQGVIYFKDVAARVIGHEAMLDHPVAEVMRDVWFVPDSKPADDLLREMQTARTHFAIVIDEYGGTAGLVTLEDIVEEVVGEIDDEYDRVTPGLEDLPDGTTRVPARMSPRDLAEHFDVTIDDDDDVETVGGLLAKLVGRVPLPGASAQVAGLQLTAERMAGRRHQLATLIVEPVDTEGRDDPNSVSHGSDARPEERASEREARGIRDDGARGSDEERVS
ncbi:hemolysin family protein [Rudaeicoccus suwonensis]|uniref:CBS domain containing-hemolysin-like protein n=1 Tax=Rudaeicoccus suwonensis TaxID=657409 RepID=A0A561E9R6_9MICO|nr:hemolysin family protein [Rudaeicoccus suwonensis]TWE12363.1 CBS domain containing-hemolysin-like protein [Rudaeicoccus suwonensis]